MMYHGFDFVPLVLLNSDFDSISVFRFGPFLFLATPIQDVYKPKTDNKCMINALYLMTISSIHAMMT